MPSSGVRLLWLCSTASRKIQPIPAELYYELLQPCIAVMMGFKVLKSDTIFACLAVLIRITLWETKENLLGKKTCDKFYGYAQTGPTQRVLFHFQSAFSGKTLYIIIISFCCTKFFSSRKEAKLWKWNCACRKWREFRYVILTHFKGIKPGLYFSSFDMS